MIGIVGGVGPYAGLALAIPEHEVNGVPMIDPSIVLARGLIKVVDPQKLKPIKQ